jgi:hypothetical protein
MRGKLPMHLRPRCGARTRSGGQCQSPAVARFRRVSPSGGPAIRYASLRRKDRLELGFVVSRRGDGLQSEGGSSGFEWGEIVLD